MNDFVIELQNLRKKISTPNSFKESYNDLKDLKDNIIAYLNMMNFIKGKITFGKDQYSLKIDFIWYDTVKDSNVQNNNIYYEIYTNLYNLALCHNFMAKLIDFENEDEMKLKETIKNLEYSVGIVDKIRTELPTLMPEREIPIDLSDQYLQFVINNNYLFYYLNFF